MAQLEIVNKMRYVTLGPDVIQLSSGTIVQGLDAAQAKDEILRNFCNLLLL